MPSTFEILPDEIVLHICHYLCGADVLYLFYNLNSRLNVTITGYYRYVNLMGVKYGQLANVVADILPSIGQHVRSFLINSYWEIMIPEYLCADLYTSRLTILLPHLEKLIIRSFKTEKLQLFIDCIDNCPNLTTLDIQCLTGNSTDICLKKIFAANQGRLTKISFDFESIYLDVSEDTSPRTFPNIKELTINLTAIRALSNLLKLVPNVRYLYIHLGIFFIWNSQNIFDDVSPLLYLVHLSIHSTGYLWPFDVLTSLIQKIPSLQQLKLSLCTKDDRFLIKDNLLLIVPSSCHQIDYFIDYPLHETKDTINNFLSMRSPCLSIVYLCDEITHSLLIHTIPCRVQSIFLPAYIGKQMVAGWKYTEYVKNLNIYNVTSLHDVYLILQHFRRLHILSINTFTNAEIYYMPTSTNPLIFRLPYLRQLHVDRKCELSTLLQASPNLNQLNISFDCLKLFIDKNPYTIQTGIKRLTVYKWIDNNAELIEDLIQIFTSLHHLEIIMNDSKVIIDSLILSILPFCTSNVKVSLGVQGLLSEEVSKNIRQWIIDHSYLSENDSFAVQYPNKCFRLWL